MLAAVALTAISIGLLLGRLYSYISILMVSPLAWLVAVMVARYERLGLGAAFLVGVAAIFALQGAYLFGVLLRSRRETAKGPAMRRAPAAKPNVLARLGKGSLRP